MKLFPAMLPASEAQVAADHDSAAEPFDVQLWSKAQNWQQHPDHLAGLIPIAQIGLQGLPIAAYDGCTSVSLKIGLKSSTAGPQGTSQLDGDQRGTPNQGIRSPQEHATREPTIQYCRTSCCQANFEAAFTLEPSECYKCGVHHVMSIDNVLVCPQAAPEGCTRNGVDRLTVTIDNATVAVKGAVDGIIVLSLSRIYH